MILNLFEQQQLLTKRVIEIANWHSLVF